MQTDLITKVYFNEHLTHSCVGMPQGLQALLSSFNQSHVMVIGRSVSFSDPARPPGGGVERPKHPKTPPPPRKKKNWHAFQNPRNIFENFSGEKNLKLKKMAF